MKLEISHDTLAKSVYDKASTDDRMRLRVANLIQTKYALFKEEKGSYLSKDDLRVIAPFEKQLDLEPAVKTFITQSRIKAFWWFLVLFVIGGVITFFFMSLSYSLNNSNATISETNKLLETNKLELQNKLDTIQDQFIELKQKDSLHQVLRLKIQDRENIISMTVEELQEALSEIKIKNKELELAKAALQVERNTLRDNNKDLTNKLIDQTRQTDKKLKNALTTVQQSQELSQKGQEILHSQSTPSEAQYKEVFRLARAAWEMSVTNSQAMDLLNEIKIAKIPAGNSGFLGKNRPKYTYTYKNIKEIIRDVDRKFKYGKLSPNEINKRLK